VPDQGLAGGLGRIDRADELRMRRGRRLDAPALRGRVCLPPRVTVQRSAVDAAKRHASPELPL